MELASCQPTGTYNLRGGSYIIGKFVYSWCIFAVAQLVEELRYKPGHGFDSPWCHWKFSLTQFFQPHCGPEVDSSSNRNEYQVYFLGGKGRQCIGLKTLPPSCAKCLEIWEPQLPGTLRTCPGL